MEEKEDDLSVETAIPDIQRLTHAILLIVSHVNTSPSVLAIDRERVDNFSAKIAIPDNQRLTLIILLIVSRTNASSSILTIEREKGRSSYRNCDSRYSTTHTRDFPTLTVNDFSRFCLSKEREKLIFLSKFRF